MSDVSPISMEVAQGLLAKLPARDVKDRRVLEQALSTAEDGVVLVPKHWLSHRAVKHAEQLLTSTGHDGSSTYQGASSVGAAGQPRKSAPPLRDITLQDAAVQPDFSLVDGGVRYPPVINGTPKPPQIVNFDGRRALEYSVPVGTATTGKERIENKLSTSGEPDALTFGNRRYTGFDFQIPKGAAPFKSSALFFQEWQGFPYGPPVALKVTQSDKSPVTLRLAVRNMDTGPNSANPDQVVWTGTLPAGSWHRFVVMVSPDYQSPNGEVKLWIDGQRVVDWKGKIGYDPAKVDGASNGFDTKFGLYQPEANNPHSVYFSDVRFSDNFLAAAP